MELKMNAIISLEKLYHLLKMRVKKIGRFSRKKSILMLTFNQKISL